MENISTFRGKLNDYKYFSTDDPNVVKRVYLTSDEIHLDKLDKNILDLDIKIAKTEMEVPKNATKDVAEAIKFENDRIRIEKEDAIEAKPVLEAIKNKCLE